MFLIAGPIRKLRATMNMDKLGGLYAHYPLLSLVIAIVLFSLVGIPPLSGFWPKIYLFEAGFMDNQYALLAAIIRSEEHTSELQSLMRISYAVFCLKKKKNNIYNLTLALQKNNNKNTDIKNTNTNST